MPVCGRHGTLGAPVSGSPASAQTQGCGYPDVNAAGAIVLTGVGQLNSRPLDLAGGAYTVRWQGERGSRSGGNLILALKRTDGTFGQHPIANAIVNADQPELYGETQLYAVKPGGYYLSVLAPGAWTVTIAPQ